MKGSTLKRLLEMSEKKRSDYDSDAKEIDNFAYNSKHTFDFDESGITFHSRISKIAQGIEIMGAHLDDPTPQRVVTARKRAPQDVIDRCKIEEELLNHFVGSTGLVAQVRMSRAQAIAHGCGVTWTGIHPETGHPQTVYDDDFNLFQDPFATNVLQRKMCFRKRSKPRWEVDQKYSVDERTKAIVSGLKSEDGTDSTDKKTDIVCYYEAYLSTGLHNYMTERLPETDETGAPVEPSNEPRKYVFSKDGKLLTEDTWEVPWHLDRKMPYELLTFRDEPGKLWSPSIFSTGINHVKMLNFIYTYFLKRYRFATRMMIGLANINGEGLGKEDVASILDINDQSPVATLKLEGMNDNRKFSDFVQELKLDSGVDSFERAYAVIERQFEQETGLYEFLHYGAGETQDRTAAATQARQAATKTRIEDMRVRFNDFQSNIARREAQAARLHLGAEQVAKIIDPGAGQAWGDVAPPEMVQQVKDMAAMQEQQFMQAQEMAAMMPGSPPPMPPEPLPVLIDYQEWLGQADHTVEASYARRKDLDMRIDSLQELNNQVNPQLLQSADPNERALAFDNMAMLFDARGVPDELVAKYREQSQVLRNMAIQQQQMAAQQAAMGMVPQDPSQPPQQGATNAPV